MAVDTNLHQRPLGGLPYEDRMRVLDNAYERLGPGQTEQAKWAVFAARIHGPPRG